MVVYLHLIVSSCFTAIPLPLTVVIPASHNAPEATHPFSCYFLLAQCSMVTCQVFCSSFSARLLLSLNAWHLHFFWDPVKLHLVHCVLHFLDILLLLCFLGQSLLCSILEFLSVFDADDWHRLGKDMYDFCCPLNLLKMMVSCHNMLWTNSIYLLQLLTLHKLPVFPSMFFPLPWSRFLELVPYAHCWPFMVLIVEMAWYCANPMRATWLIVWGQCVKCNFFRLCTSSLQRMVFQTQWGVVVEPFFPAAQTFIFSQFILILEPTGFYSSLQPACNHRETEKYMCVLWIMTVLQYWLQVPEQLWTVHSQGLNCA